MKKIRRQQPNSGINITPLTDVALVLLIIFMVATPMLMQSKVNIALPPNDPGTKPDTQSIVGLDKTGIIYFNKTKLSLEELRSALAKKAAANPGIQIIVNCDKEVKYDDMIRVLDGVKQSGVKRLQLGMSGEAAR